MPAMKLDGYNMDAIDWWEAYGSKAPSKSSRGSSEDSISTNQ